MPWSFWMSIVPVFVIEPPEPREKYPEELIVVVPALVNGRISVKPPPTMQVAPEAIVVLPIPLSVPPLMLRTPPDATVRLPEPVVVPVGVNVPCTVTVAPELTVRPLKPIVSAARMSGWLPPLLTVAVSPVSG